MSPIAEEGAQESGQFSRDEESQASFGVLMRGFHSVGFRRIPFLELTLMYPSFLKDTLMLSHLIPSCGSGVI